MQTSPSTGQSTGQSATRPPAGQRLAPHAATPLGLRKRCPWCERLRQSGGTFFAAKKPRRSSPAQGAARAAGNPGSKTGKRASGFKLLALLALAAVGLQLYFLLRVGMAAVINPESTAFQRSELWRLSTCPPQRCPTKNGKPHEWQQQWLPYERIADSLKRAVMASEDSGFASHSGVEWGAIENAWRRNAKALDAAEKQAQAEQAVGSVRLRGGSTITQQLAKNLWLSSERSYPRKAQELVLAKALEAALTKRRILEIYLNNVEWGEGVFGAEAAARRYFGKSASALTAMESARLAVMLPRPKYFEQRPGSAYLQRQSRRIAARMRQVKPP